MKQLTHRLTVRGLWSISEAIVFPSDLWSLIWFDITNIKKVIYHLCAAEFWAVCECVYVCMCVCVGFNQCLTAHV